ncbi:helix-turn-helix transcriptional regulator [Eubacterium sp. 1001713B170207_170306_E7]|uniref:helix-turn-helix domain-containing protein n=1 Tax=Eubacterium sp. 1001713B170207_170306_E7 TaxID=2787097 RepID=UPI00189A932D|nr:helix-turn-helix transcriptional regulator [Eubacterium sp. 1001713B170207_170306_E7]
MNSKYLGQRLRQFRKDAHLTQNQLAKKAGITPTYLSIIERGAQLPRLETFIRLANILSVSADDLLMEEPAENRDDSRAALHILSDDLTEEQLALVENMVKLMCDHFKITNH